MPDLTIVLSGVAVVLLAAFLKGIVGFGFPTTATTLLALFVDVKVAVALVIPEGLLKSPRMRRLALFRALAS